MVFEDGLVKQRLPFANQDQPFFGVLQTGFGPSQDLHGFTERRVMIGRLLKLASEHLGLGRRNLLAPPLDLFLPVIRTLLLKPLAGPAHLGLDTPGADSVSSEVQREAGAEVLECIDRMDFRLRAHKAKFLCQ